MPPTEEEKIPYEDMYARSRLTNNTSAAAASTPPSDNPYLDTVLANRAVDPKDYKLKYQDHRNKQGSHYHAFYDKHRPGKEPEGYQLQYAANRRGPAEEEKKSAESESDPPAESTTEKDPKDK